MNQIPQNLTPQQQAMLRQQMAQQNPQIQAQMRAQQQQALYHRQQMAMAQAQAVSYGGMPGAQQHLQGGYHQQRRSSPMGQMPMSQPGQMNPMAGFGAMPPPSSAGPMGAGMQPGMHPQQSFPQQPQQQQQYMQPGNPQYQGMNSQMMSIPPMAPNTPNRPPSQVQVTPSPVPQSGNPTNPNQTNGITPPGQQAQGGLIGAQITSQSNNAQSTKTPQKMTDAPALGNEDDKAHQQTKRIEVLLELNSVMLKCIIDLQEKGKAAGSKAEGQGGGQQSPTSSTPTDQTHPIVGGNQSPTATSQPQRPTNSEWIQFMKRLQSNIAYLMGQGIGPNQRKPLWPPFMDIHPAPQDAVIGEETYKQLKQLYQKLREAIPEYKAGLNPVTGQPMPTPKAAGAMGPPNPQASATKPVQQSTEPATAST